MAIFDPFKARKFKYFEFLTLKIVNFDTKINIDHFSNFSRICSFWTKNGTLTHCSAHNTTIEILRQRKSCRIIIVILHTHTHGNDARYFFLSFVSQDLGDIEDYFSMHVEISSRSTVCPKKFWIEKTTIFQKIVKLEGDL